MTAGTKVEHTRRMTGSVAVGPRGLKKESRPSCVLGNAGLGQTAPHSANARIRQNLVHGAGCRPVTKCANVPAPEPPPIWMAALFASACEASVNGSLHSICWENVAGRAIYTNNSREAEIVQPFGVKLQGGETLAVFWTPSDTAYTLEVYSSKPQYLVA